MFYNLVVITYKIIISPSQFFYETFRKIRKTDGDIMMLYVITTKLQWQAAQDLSLPNQQSVLL